VDLGVPSPPQGHGENERVRGGGSRQPPHLRDLVEKLDVGCLIPSLHGETWGKGEREEGEVEIFLPSKGNGRTTTGTRGI
jgi:hypothetical protein